MDEPPPAHTEKPSAQSTWRDATGGLKQNGEEKGRRERRGNKSKGEGLGGTSALEHLPSRHEVLGLRTSTGQKNKKPQAWWSLYVRAAGKLQSLGGFLAQGQPGLHRHTSSGKKKEKKGTKPVKTHAMQCCQSAYVRQRIPSHTVTECKETQEVLLCIHEKQATGRWSFLCLNG